MRADVLAGERLTSITPELLGRIARGAALLGTGGGGDPYVGQLMAANALEEFGPVEVVALEDVPDDAEVAAVGIIGAPTVGVEKILSGTEVLRAIDAVEEARGKRLTHLVCTEVGGENSMLPVLAAARTGLPLIDADGMGRAFPELQMLTPGLAGHPATPLGLSDEKGNVMTLRSPDNHWAERISRAATIVMGCSAVYAMYPMSGAHARDAYISGTLSWAWRLGRSMEAARRAHDDVPTRIIEELGGAELFSGKVTSVERHTKAGFAIGVAQLDGFGAWAGSVLELSFQNEHLLAVRDGGVVATTPDLICVVESETGVPVTTEGLHFGARVTAIAAPANERWRTPEGIALVGPRYFGYDVDYVPFEELLLA